MKKVAVIGAGHRIGGICTAISGFEKVCLAAVCDPDFEGAKERIATWGMDTSNTAFYEPQDLEKMLDVIKPDGVLIGTRCNLHARLAEPVLKRNIPLFLEKPVGICEEDLAILEKYADRKNTVVSFPLRVSKLAQRAKSIVESGELGTISQIQAANNVNYARGYYKKWYRDESITGGLFLQKATHDLDVIRYVAGFEPVMLTAVKSKVVLKGDHPAGLRCSECPEEKTCKESVYNLTHCADEPSQPDTCTYGVDTGNEDSGSVILIDAEGRHAVYSQNFVVRKGAGKRLFRIIGDDATLEFNFFDSTLTVFYHYKNEVVKHVIGEGAGHSGGDKMLAKNFLDVIEGKETDCSLSEGIISAKICLRAKESAETLRFITI